MVNEWVYCPRLAFLEWVDGEWADSGDTEEGRRVSPITLIDGLASTAIDGRTG
jgi:hypothetical protein